jgi:hypothetical protein
MDIFPKIEGIPGPDYSILSQIKKIKWTHLTLLFFLGSIIKGFKWMIKK